MAIPVLRSLTLKQAIHAVLAAFVVGLTITAAEFAWTATRERTVALAQVADAVALVEGPAASAAWKWPSASSSRPSACAFRPCAMASSTVMAPA